MLHKKGSFDCAREGEQIHEPVDGLGLLVFGKFRQPDPVEHLLVVWSEDAAGGKAAEGRSGTEDEVDRVSTGLGELEDAGQDRGQGCRWSESDTKRSQEIPQGRRVSDDLEESYHREVSDEPAIRPAGDNILGEDDEGKGDGKVEEVLLVVVADPEADGGEFGRGRDLHNLGRYKHGRKVHSDHFAFGEGEPGQGDDEEAVLVDPEAPPEEDVDGQGQAGAFEGLKQVRSGEVH